MLGDDLGLKAKILGLGLATRGLSKLALYLVALLSSLLAIYKIWDVALDYTLYSKKRYDVY